MKGLLCALSGAMLLVGLALPTWATTVTWMGGGGDDLFGTSANWLGGTGPSAPLASDPGDSLVFGAVGTSAPNAESDLAFRFQSITFEAGGYTLSGEALAVSQTQTSSPAVLNEAGANSIGSPVHFVAVDHDPTVSVTAGSLELTDGVRTSSSNVDFTASGGSLSIAGSVRPFAPTGSGPTPVADPTIGLTATSGGSIASTGSIEAGNVSVVAGSASSVSLNDVNADSLSVSGSGDVTVGGDVAVGSVTVSGATLLLDADAAGSLDVADLATVSLSGGATLALQGDASDPTTETLGALTLSGDGNTVELRPGGDATTLVFSSLSAGGAGYFNLDATSGTLGGGAGEPTLLFTADPSGASGLIEGAIVNGGEFASYDATDGVQAASDESNLDAATALSNVHLTSAQTPTGPTVMNSLSVDVAGTAISGSHDVSITSGQLLLAQSSTINPTIAFGATEGEVYTFGTSILSGGVDGSSGLTVRGTGSVILGASTLSGDVDVSSGTLIAGGSGVFSGNDISVSGALDVGATTQAIGDLDVVGGSLNTTTGLGNAFSVMTLSGAAVTGGGTLTASTVTASSSSITADLSTAGLASLTSSSLTGDITSSAGGVTVDRSTVTGDVQAVGLVRVEGTEIASIQVPAVVTGSVVSTGSNVILDIASVGDVSGGSVTATDSSTGDVVASGSVSMTGSSVTGSVSGTGNVTVGGGDVDGDVISTGGTVALSGTTIGGNVSSSSSLDIFGSTIGGIVSGTTASFSSVSTLLGDAAHTGATDVAGLLILSDEGALSSTPSVDVLDGSLLLLSGADSSGVNVDRVGDSTSVSLGDVSSLAVAGNSGAGQSVDERIGVLSVDAGAEASVSVTDGASGSVLRGSSLATGTGSLLFFDIGSQSSVFFDTAPPTLGGRLDDVFVEKTIGSGQMPTWTQYSALNGVEEYAAPVSSIAAASSTAHIRVTDATNAAVNGSETVGGVIVDTTSATGAVAGSGSVTITGGNLLFFSDQDFDVATLDFGSAQGFVANTGSNTISSAITGTAGLRKHGDGTLFLSGTSTYSGTTDVSRGALEVSGSIASDVNVGSGTSLVVSGTVNGQVSNFGVTQLTGSGIVSSVSNSSSFVMADSSRVSNDFTNGSILSMGGSSTIGGDLINSGSLLPSGSATIEGNATNSGIMGSGVGSAAGVVDGNLQNTGRVSGWAEVGGQLNNSGTVDVLSSLTVGVLNNAGVLIGSGSVTDYGVNSDPFDITLESSNETREIVGDLVLSSGSTVVFGFEGPGGDNGFLDVTGDLSLAGSVLISDVGGLAEGTYTLFEVLGSLTGDENSLTISGASGFDASIEIAVDNTVSLVLAAIPLPPIETVPEPGTLVLVGLGLALLSARNRRNTPEGLAGCGKTPPVAWHASSSRALRCENSL